MLLGVAVRRRRAVRPAGPADPAGFAAGVAILVIVAGCAGRPSSKTPKGAQDTPEPPPDARALTVDRTRCDSDGKRSDHEDLNHDGRADLIALYAGDGSDGALACKQADLNFDGRLDAYFHYDNEGNLEREQFDLDFDGRIDAGRYYRNGEVVLDEQDTNQDGFVDTWRRYEKGQLVRMETDRDADGKADMLTYFVGGHIDRIGYDVNGDGRVDQWDHDAARRARLAAQHRQATTPESPAESVEYVDEPDAGDKSTPEGTTDNPKPSESTPAAAKVPRQAPSPPNRNNVPDSRQQPASGSAKAPPGHR